MNTEDTVRMERLEYAKALERQQRLQADRQARDELRSQATAEGLSEQERRRRILAFMCALFSFQSANVWYIALSRNYKGESDEDEDNEEAEDDDSYEYGNYGVISYQNQGRPDLDYFENEDALADDGDGMDLDQLSNLIKVDTKNACWRYLMSIYRYVSLPNPVSWFPILLTRNDQLYCEKSRVHIFGNGSPAVQTAF